MRIRATTEADRAAILAVHERAFGPEQGPEIAELVAALLADETAAPRLSLVAEADGRAVGHVLFTAVRIQEETGQEVSARILAPLAVSTERQREGIGGSLIREGLRRLEASGVELVFVLGDPGYYARFGFRPAWGLGYEAPHPIPPEHEDAWMVRALKAGVVGRVRGRLRCAEALDEPRHWHE